MSFEISDGSSGSQEVSNMSSNAKWEFNAGVLIRHHIRQFLNKEMFLRKNIEYYESKGFFDSNFIVKGEYNQVKRIHDIILDWHRKKS
jgi:hypothetical protein